MSASTSGDEHPADEEPVFTSDSDSDVKLPKKRLSASGVVRVLFHADPRDPRDLNTSSRTLYPGRYVYSVIKVEVFYTRGRSTSDKDLKKAEKWMKKKLKKKARSPDIACMHCTTALTRIGYRVVSVEGAERYPEVNVVHAMSIQFVRPV